MTVPDTGVHGRTIWLIGLTEYAGVTRYTGGIGTHYSALLSALGQQGHDIRLVLFTDEAVEIEQLPPTVHLVGTHALHRVPRWIRPLVHAAIFRRSWSSVRPDVVYVPEWTGVASLLPRRAVIVTNLATGLRLGDWIASREKRDLPLQVRLTRWLQDRLETRQIRRSRGLVPISRAVLEWNVDHIGRLPPSVIVGNCVDTNSLASPSSVLPAGWPLVDRDAPVILFAGRLEVRKGVDIVMIAFSHLLASYPEACLVLCGESGDSRFEPTRQDLLDRVPQESRGQVVFLGHLDRESLSAAMAAATLVACPSLWEGFGNVALEVKAVGVPLVVTSGSGFDDFCTDGIDCLVVPPGDPGALSHSFSRLIESADLRRRLVRNARESVDEYIPGRIARVTTEAVRLLCDQRTSKR